MATELNMSPLPHQSRIADKLEDQEGQLAFHQTGSGKCQDPSTLIVTRQGLSTLGSLFPPTVPTSEEISSPPSEVWTPYGWKAIRRAVRMPAPARVSLLTRRGHGALTTTVHPFLVVKAAGEGLTWATADTIAPGDWIACEGSAVERQDGADVTADLAELMGWMVAEGGETGGRNCHGRLFCNKDPAVIARFRQLVTECLGYDPTETRVRRDVSYVHISQPKYDAAVVPMGYKAGMPARHKIVPRSLMVASPAARRAFLRAYFEGDGSCSSTNIEVTSASKELAEGVAVLLSSFGIRSAYAAKRSRATNGKKIYRTYYRLSISGEDTAAFEGHIGFMSERKCTALAILSAKARNPNMGIPVGWLLRKLEQYGLRTAVVNAAKGNAFAESWAIPAVAAGVKKLRELANPSTLTAWFNALSTRGGTVGQHRDRTFAAATTHQSELSSLADSLELVLASGFRFEPIETVTQVAANPAEWVCDIEVDTENENERCYYSGAGMFVSHNTMTAINAAHQHNLPLLAVVPAALRNNMRKEIAASGFPGKHEVVSYEEAVKRKDDPAFREQASNSLVAFDEAARMGQAGSARSTLGEDLPAAKRLLLSGTPIRNSPQEIAPLINAVSPGSLPKDPKAFEAQYIDKRVIPVGFVGRLMGLKPGPALKRPKNLHEFEKAVRGKVDFYSAVDRSHYPSSSENIIETPMGNKQQAAYDYVMGNYPQIAYKIRHGLPPSKSEEADFRSFFNGPRRVSNHPGDFHAKATDADAPKIQAAVNSIEEHRKNDPNYRGYSYSGFLGAGIDPMSRELTKRGIPHGVFTGSQDDTEKKKIVEDYNAGRVPHLLISGAGAEGLDLKGTKLTQILEPHWHEEQINQVKARGNRYKSHAHLPEEERHVHVERYHTVPQAGWMDRLLGRKRGDDMSIDEYLYNRALEKQKLNEPFLRILRGEHADVVQRDVEKQGAFSMALFGGRDVPQQENLGEPDLYDRPVLHIKPTYETRCGILFDLDDTLTHTENDDWNNVDAQKLIPGRLPFLVALKNKGYALVGITNRSVYHPGSTEETVHAQVAKTVEMLGEGLLEDIFYIPGGQHPAHKPAPDMLVLAMHRHGINPLTSVMVGDSPNDEGAARAAGIPWVHPDQFFAVDPIHFPDAAAMTGKVPFDVAMAMHEAPTE